MSIQNHTGIEKGYIAVAQDFETREQATEFADRLRISSSWMSLQFSIPVFPNHNVKQLSSVSDPIKAAENVK